MISKNLNETKFTNCPNNVRENVLDISYAYLQVQMFSYFKISLSMINLRTTEWLFHAQLCKQFVDSGTMSL